jgi:hypothetical protein
MWPVCMTRFWFDPGDLMFFRLFTLLCTGQSVIAQRKQDKTYHQLVNRLFPELFAPDHLRTTYSYHGQGKINKSKLDPIRKGYVQRYVLYFHPKILPEHGCFQDQRDATSPGKANTTVMKRQHDWHKSQIIRNIRYIFVVNASVTPQNSIFSCYHFYVHVINVLSVETA